MEKEIYLTADLTDAVPAPRFAWYNPETDEKEPIYYPEDPEDPELELLDNEGEISYEDVSVLACPFCRRVLRFSEIAVLPEETEEAALRASSAKRSSRAAPDAAMPGMSATRHSHRSATERPAQSWSHSGSRPAAAPSPCMPGR